MILTSSFHDGLIFKRLNAMKQRVRRIKPWKTGILLIFSILLSVVFACRDDHQNQQLGSNASYIQLEELPASMQKDLAEKKENLTFIKAALIDGQLPEDAIYLKNLDMNLVQAVSVIKDDVYFVLKSSDAKIASNEPEIDTLSHNYLKDKVSTESGSEIFTIVEQGPEYPGGMAAFYQMISHSISYPQEARENQIEGRVYVQFIVDENGSLNYPEIVKGIGYGCDEEALKAIQSSGKWIPGQQRGRAVKVRMVLPIIFNLNSSITSNLGEAS